MTAITADSLSGRILLALRAGPVEDGALRERFAGKGCVHQLLRQGLIVKRDGEYLLTAAGRAACPLRNPLAAPAAAVNPQAAAAAVHQEQTIMGRGPITRRAVLDAIIAAGPAGITTKELSVRLGCTDESIRRHISLASAAAVVTREMPPIERVGRGRYAAAQPAPAAVDEAEVAVIPAPAGIQKGGTLDPGLRRGDADYAEMIDFDLEEAQGADLTAATPDVAALEANYHALRGEVGNLLDVLSLAVGVKDAAEARVKELERRLAALESGAHAGACYAVAFASDFHDSIESAVSRAAECYDSDSLKTAVVIACSPLGGIDVRPMFVSREAA